MRVERRVLKREKNERRAIERKIEITEWCMNNPKLILFLNSVKLPFKKIREYLEFKPEGLLLLGFAILSLTVGCFFSVVAIPSIIFSILGLIGLISTISIGIEDDFRYDRIIEKFIEENPVELQKILEYLNVEKEELLSQLADIKNNPQQKVKKIS